MLIGLPDTIWFPTDGLRQLPASQFSFLLFPVDSPQLFDAVSCDPEGSVLEVEVKQPKPKSHWIWGAFRLPGRTLMALHHLWCDRNSRDEYFGTLVNAYLAMGGAVRGIKKGKTYVDVGTLHGYREAIRVLCDSDASLADAA